MKTMKTRTAAVAVKKLATQRVSASWGQGAVPFEPMCPRLLPGDIGPVALFLLTLAASSSGTYKLLSAVIN